MSATEDRIASVARAAVADAIAKMDAVVLRYLAEGRPIDAAMMTSMAAELQRIADEYGQKIVINGELGKLMQQQRVNGAKAGGADTKWLVLNSDALKAALENDRVKIKGMLAGTADKVNEIIVAARISGKPRAEVVREIMERVQTEGEITKARAETIYRAETFSSYRQWEHAADVAAGINYFMQRGTVDDRTTALCLSHIGQIKSEKEWLELEPLVFSYGLHYKCRCKWIGVVNPEAQRIKDRAKLYRDKAIEEQKKRKAEDRKVAA